MVADAPFLNCAGPVGIGRSRSTPFAVQLTQCGSQPHVFGDAVGQVFLFYVTAGQVCWRRRNGLESPWDTQQVIPGSQQGREPWADKDDAGRLIAMWQRADSEVRIAVSRDDGSSWQDVR